MRYIIVLLGNTWCTPLTDEMAMPWPLRLLELGDGAGVELVVSGCVDPEMCHYSDTEPCKTNHSLLLRWYCGSQHCQLDLRLAIRRHLKEVSVPQSMTYLEV